MSSAYNKLLSLVPNQVKNYVINELNQDGLYNILEGLLQKLYRTPKRGLDPSNPEYFSPFAGPTKNKYVNMYLNFSANPMSTHFGAGDDYWTTVADDETWDIVNVFIFVVEQLLSVSTAAFQQEMNDETINIMKTIINKINEQGRNLSSSAVNAVEYSGRLVESRIAKYATESANLEAANKLLKTQKELMDYYGNLPPPNINSPNSFFRNNAQETVALLKRNGLEYNSLGVLGPIKTSNMPNSTFINNKSLNFSDPSRSDFVSKFGGKIAKSSNANEVSAGGRTIEDILKALKAGEQPIFGGQQPIISPIRIVQHHIQ